MQLQYQCPKLASNKYWTPDHARIIYTICVVFLLVEGSTICPPGRMPPDCQQVCRLGYFGSDCVFPCPTTCTNRTCQPESGFCYQCQLGFTGLNCSHTCHRGFFGQDCNDTCPPGCFRKICDPFTGLCEKCVPGYEGVRCETHYLFRNHTNETSSSLSHEDQVQKQTYTYVNAAIYITTAVVICIMSLSSVALCSYLEKLKARQKHLKTLPIYRKHSLDSVPSSFLRWSESPTKHEYIEMETIDTDNDTVGEVDVKPNLAANSLAGRRAMDAGKGTLPTSRNHGKRLFALLCRWKACGRGDRRLPVLPKNTEEFVGNQDNVATPELSKILKTHAPLRVKQAANYSKDLYFKSCLHSQGFPSGVNGTQDSVKEPQQLSWPVCSTGPVAALSLPREQNTEDSTNDLGLMDEREQRVTELSDGLYSPRSISEICVTDQCGVAAMNRSKKAMLNMARDLLQTVKHRRYFVQHARGSSPTGEDSSSSSALPRTPDYTVLSTDITQSEKNEENKTMPSVSDGHRSRVYAETTEPLLTPGRPLWHARKSLTTFMRRVVTFWTRDIHEPMAEEQLRAVESAAIPLPEITMIPPEPERQERQNQSEFLCNCLDCEIQTEARKFDLEYTYRGFHSQVKGHYKDLVAHGVAANADTITDKTKCQQQVTCSTVGYDEDDDAGINKYIFGIISRQVKYRHTFNDLQSQENTDGSSESSYTLLPREQVRRLKTAADNDVQNITDNVSTKNSHDIGTESRFLTVPATSRNPFSSRRSLVDDATNNFSFCCVSREQYTGSQNIRVLTSQEYIPQVSVSCPELLDPLPELCKSQHVHDPCIESYYQERFCESRKASRMHTARSKRRAMSHSLSDPEKNNSPYILETSVNHPLRPYNFAGVGVADLDTLSIEAVPGAGVILLSMYRANMTPRQQTIANIDALDEIKKPANVDLYIPEVNFEAGTVETPHENREARNETGNTSMQSSQSVDQNPQGKNMGRDIGECVSLIPKSVISLTVRKHPNREIKPAYTGDIEIKGDCEQSQLEGCE